VLIYNRQIVDTYVLQSFIIILIAALSSGFLTIQQD